MKQEIEPLIIAIIIFVLFVASMILLIHSYFLFNDLRKVADKLGEKVFNWLIDEDK